uniref:Uncharacterized protein n=1 Tax=Gossypium raimondii TaxID=29730 RepID=A0A0D2SCY7_GOSRA|nr:hypothetical protein B456_005G082200 [Gossypium raimondii]
MLVQCAFQITHLFLLLLTFLQFKCMACAAKITTYSLEGSEKLLQLVSNYSMVSNLKENESEVWNQGFFMSPIGKLIYTTLKTMDITWACSSSSSVSSHYFDNHGIRGSPTSTVIGPSKHRHSTLGDPNFNPSQGKARWLFCYSLLNFDGITLFLFLFLSTYLYFVQI